MSTPGDRAPLSTPPRTPDPPSRGRVWAASLSDPERIAILMATIEGIADGVVVADASGRFLLFNPAAERIIRIGMTESTPADWPERYGLFLPDGTTPYPSDRLPLVRAMKGETVKEEEIYVRHADAPEGLWLSVNATPFRDAEGATLGGIAVFRDVTDRKRMEGEFTLAKERAEEASRAKGVFLATMSHEIRTPLNSILGMTHILNQTPLTREQGELLKVIQDSGQTLLSLIEDTLDYSKIEAGRLALERVPFELRRTVGHAVRLLARSAHEKGLELAFRVDRGVPDALVGDPGRLRQVLLNLLGNALKFTEQGEVILKVALEKERPPAVALRFSVTDTGIGIPRDKQQIIFESFEQADGSTTRKYGGTGLGLAIVSRFVELMGGRIWVESAVERGSTFSFTATFESGDPRPRSPISAWAGKRALVVDGHRTSRAFLVDLLNELGLAGEAAGDAREAMARLRAPGPRPELLLVDARLPGTTGLELLEEAWGETPPGPATILLLPSGDPPGELDRAEALGIHDYLSKPVREEELREILERLAFPGTAAEALLPSPPARGRPLRVLLVEDSAANRTLAARLLEGWGHRVLAAANGSEAIEIARREPVDLVLMDVEMPELDGLEATRRLRGQEGGGGRRVPVYAMTAHALPDERARCLAAGMDGFITKPIDIERLRATLERIGEPTPPI